MCSLIHYHFSIDILMAIDLYDHQLKAIDNLHNGAILCGGVGTGKSRTALAYYYLKVCEGTLKINGEGSLTPMKSPRDLYIITTAKKRDTFEWLDECAPFCLTTDSKCNMSGVNVVVDSWNNIHKYRKVIGAFFIFDEQRVVGSGAWVKAFLDISRKNKWILLSATPGDTWSDYIPVFVANGYYKNKTEFQKRHVVFNRFAKYPKIDHYVDTGYLVKLRNQTLVLMKYEKPTIQHNLKTIVSYSKDLYLQVVRFHWDPFENKPIKETGKMCYLMRRVVNSDPSRADAVFDIIQEHKKVIIFYNYDYELDILRSLCSDMGLLYKEWNGQKHEEVPTGDSWAYLVQYSAGSEGWNCITTDTMIFYSQNYSYRMMIQAAGRIDRLNTKFVDLYYYHLKSSAPIDIAIGRALAQKRNFNERSFIGK